MPGLYDYQLGERLEAQDLSFYGLIQAAMRKADSNNRVLLRLAFPEEWDDLEARYNAPGGRLPAEQ